jgi:hypothetical protein
MHLHQSSRSGELDELLAPPIAPTRRHGAVALIIPAHNEFRRSFELRLSPKAFIFLAGQPFGTESIKYFAQLGTPIRSGRTSAEYADQEGNLNEN